MYPLIFFIDVTCTAGCAASPGPYLCSWTNWTKFFAQGNNNNAKGTTAGIKTTTFQLEG